MTRGSSFLKSFLLAVGLFLLALRYLCAFEADPDLWGHLTFGEDILQDGQIVREDVYSFTAAGRVETKHEWLSEVLMAFAWKAGGHFGLWLYASFLIIGMTAVLFAILRNRLRDRLSLFLMIALYLAGSQMGHTVRPQLWSYFLIIMLMWILDRDSGRPGPGGSRWLWFIPILFALWVNLHGGFIAGLGILFLYGLSAVFERIRAGRPEPSQGSPNLRVVAGVILASFLATFLNPYGYKLWKFLIYTLSLPREQVTEWMGLWDFIRLDPTYWMVAIVIVIVVLFVMLYRGSIRNFEKICFLVTTLLAIVHVRHIPIASIFWTLAIASVVGPILRRIWHPEGEYYRRVNQITRILIVSMTVLIAFSGPYRFVKFFTPRRLGIKVTVSDYPVHAVNFIRKTGLKGNLICSFNWGEYLIAKLYPEIRVSMDGRYRTVYSPEIIRQNRALELGEPEGLPLLHRDDVDLLLVRLKNTRIEEMMSKESGWKLVYRDDAALLYARLNEKNQTILERLGDEPWIETDPAKPEYIPFQLHGEMVEDR